MAVTDLAAALWEAKEVYANYVVEQRNLEPLWLEHLESDDTMEYNAGGKYFVFPIEFSGGESVGAYRESGALPGGNPASAALGGGSTALRGDQGRINVKQIAFTHRITGKAKASIHKGVQGFFDTLDRSIKQKTKITRNDMNRQAHSAGRGILGGGGNAVLGGGNITAVTSAATSVITLGPKTNMDHFAVSMRVDFWTADLVTRHGALDSTTEDVGWPITAVNRTARTISVLGDINAGALVDVIAGDVVTRENVAIGVGAAGEGNELTGLLQLVQDSDVTASLQNLSFGTWPEYAAYINRFGGVDRDITEQLLESVKDEVETRGGKTVDLIVMNKGQRQKLVQIGLANVRHESAKLHLGWEELTWNGKTFFIDRHAIKGMIFLGCKSELARYLVQDWGSLDVNTGGERIPHFDITELVYGTYKNIGIKQTSCFGRLDDLAEPSL